MMEPSTELGVRLVDEIARLPEVFGVRLVLWVSVVVVATVLGRGAVAAGVRLLWRIGLDRARRLGRLAALLRVLVWTLGALLVLRPVFRAVPVLTALTVAVAALLVALALPRLVQSVVAGLSLAVRARFREGDQIEVLGHRGSIRTLGIVRTQLRVEDGSSVWLPNVVLDREAVRVDRSTGAAPVRVHVAIPVEGRDYIVEQLSRAVTLLPYRRAGSVPRVVPASDDELEWVIELQTWATRELTMVRRALRRTVDDILQPEQGGRS
jgi:small conductance mechanosensitive channel